MAGKIVRVLPLTVYDIGSSLSHGGDTTTFTAGREIDVSEYREAILVVRQHSFYTNVSGPSWQVRAYLSGFTVEDEKAEFTGATVLADTGVQQPAAGAAVPSVIAQTFSLPFGSLVRVKVTLNGAGTFICSVGLSIDIVAKC